MTESDETPDLSVFEVPPDFLVLAKQAAPDNEIFLESLTRVKDMADFIAIKNFLKTSMNMYDQWQKQTLGQGDGNYYGYIGWNRQYSADLMKLYTQFRDLLSLWESYEGKLGKVYSLPPAPWS